MTGAEVYARFNRLKRRLVILTGLVILLFLIGVDQRPFSFLMRALGQDHTVVDEYIEINESLSNMTWQDDKTFRTKVALRRQLLKEAALILDAAGVGDYRVSGSNIFNEVELFPETAARLKYFDRLDPDYWQDARMKTFVQQVESLLSEAREIRSFSVEQSDAIGKSRLEELADLNSFIEARLKHPMQIIDQAYRLEERRRTIRATFSAALEIAFLGFVLTGISLTQVWPSARAYVLRKEEPLMENRADLWQSETFSIVWVLGVIAILALFSYGVIGKAPYTWLHDGSEITSLPAGAIAFGGLITAILAEYGRSILNKVIARLRRNAETSD